MKAFRLSDLSLVVKMGVAPAFAVLMLAVLAGTTFWNQQQQTQAVDRIVQQDMSVSQELARISKRITAVHGDLYLVMTHHAAAPTIDSTAKLTTLMGDVDAIKAELVQFEAKMPPAAASPMDRQVPIPSNPSFG